VTSPAVELAGAMPPDTNLRIGIARSDGGTITVEVAGNVIQCGFLDPATVTADTPVAVLRFGSTWLCLGRIITQPA